MLICKNNYPSIDSTINLLIADDTKTNANYLFNIKTEKISDIFQKLLNKFSPIIVLWSQMKNKKRN